MADVEMPVEAVTEAGLQESVSEAAANATGAKIPATPEGMALAYGSLLIMALLPIFFGSFRSIQSHKDNKETSARTGEKPETMTQKDAAMFPIIASCALFGLYLFFTFFSKEHINLLLSVYFFVLGIFALTHMVSPLIINHIPARLIPLHQFHLRLTEGLGENDTKTEVVSYDFSTHDLVLLALSAVVGVWYFLKKHWIANNLFGLDFDIN